MDMMPGGGLLTNGRTAERESDIPQTQPIKPPRAAQGAPMPAQAPQAAPMPQQSPAPSGGLVGAPPEQMPQGQGMPGGQMAPEGVNSLANNASMLIDETEEAGMEMIAQGPEGAAQYAVMIGKQVVAASLNAGVEPAEEEMEGAIDLVLGDIAEMGRMSPEEAETMQAHALAGWAQEFPEFGESLQRIAAEEGLDQGAPTQPQATPGGLVG